MANINGWSRGTWSEGAWSRGLPVPVTGSAGTGVVGTVLPVSNNTLSVTGLAATGGLSSVTVTAAADVPVTGLAGTGVTGNVLVWSEINPDQNPSWTEIAA